MSIRSSGNSVTVTTTFVEEHTTWLRGSFSSVTVQTFPPYLINRKEWEFDRHPTAQSWSFRRPDSKLLTLPSGVERVVNADGKVYFGVEEITDVDGKIIISSTSFSRRVDSKVGIGVEVTRDSDGKVILSSRPYIVEVDGKVVFSSGPSQVFVDGKVIFSRETVGVDADARTFLVHISDVQWIYELLSQVLPEIRSSPQVHFVPLILEGKERREVIFPGGSGWKKFVYVNGSSVSVHEYVRYWKLVGISSEETNVFQCSVAAEKVRLTNLSSSRRFAVVVTYR